jgi:5'-3' exonuclease
VFVYDSKPPPEKEQERKNRSEAREKNKIRVEKILTAWDNYKNSIYHQGENIVNINEIEDDYFSSYLQKISNQSENNGLSVLTVEQELDKLKNTLLSIRSQDFITTKEIFSACEIPFIDAEGEAEATCVELVRKGLVTAVLTEDTDVIAYGVPIMLHKMDFTNNTFVEIDYEEILTSLNMTNYQFLDFCIMCGTDYNQNIPRIGPEKAFRLLKQYGSIEEIQNNIPNLSYDNFSYQKTRELFTPCINIPSIIPYCGFPKKIEFERLYFLNNCHYNLDTFYCSFQSSVYHEFNIVPDDLHSISEEIGPKKKSLLLIPHVSL